MSGWYGYSSGSGPEREPSEDGGQAAWAAREPGSPPPWAHAETQTDGVLPPVWTPPPYPVTASPEPQLPYRPAPAPRRSAGRLAVTLALAVLLGVGAGTGAWYLMRDDTAGAGAGGTPATSVGVTTATPERTGYRRAEDPVGYSLSVPEGWTRRQKQGQLAAVVSYDSPDDGRHLQIFALAEDTPAQSLDLAENDPGYGFARRSGYRVLDRASGDTWAELTYRYDDPDVGPRRVVDHRFRAVDGTLYAIRSSGPETLNPAQVRDPLTTAVRSFCPTGGECA
ncbi:hypothetical protein [Streptomyces griseus]|uniref:hypothetical protein n=1 Tax=Streptomyces griseus TaxID=1911 RepID=UPI00055B3352|nr:hypothetical protein [Streptomyces griseus]